MPHLHPVNREHHDEIPWSVRIAERVTGFMGSPPFIAYQSAFIAFWLALNITGLVTHWDPYPFILLNLAFSTQAAYAAPLILLAQNRSSKKDREMAEFDFQHNSESLALLRAVHGEIHSPDCQCHVTTDGRS